MVQCIKAAKRVQQVPRSEVNLRNPLPAGNEVREGGDHLKARGGQFTPSEVQDRAPQNSGSSKKKNSFHFLFLNLRQTRNQLDLVIRQIAV